MCTEWPQNDLEHYEVKSTPYTPYNYISIHFTLQPLIFELQAILRRKWAQNDIKH